MSKATFLRQTYGNKRQLFQLEGLLEQGADPNESDARSGAPPLYSEAKYANLVDVEFLIKAGAVVDFPLTQKGTGGKTALCAAILSESSSDNSVKIVQLLVEAGADVNLKTESGDTPLHFVAQNGRLKNQAEIAEFLIQAGADANARNKKGAKPADIAGPKIKDLLTQAQSSSSTTTSKPAAAAPAAKPAAAAPAAKPAAKPAAAAPATAATPVAAPLSPQSEEKKDLYKFLFSMFKHVTSKREHPLKVFISYTWPRDKERLDNLQNRLKWYKETLEMVGAEVFLDIYDMEGGIKNSMQTKLEGSDKYLLICTPDMKTRVAETNKNNMVYELEAAMKKQKANPNFMIPIIVEGDFGTSVPMNVDGRDESSTFRDILALTHLVPENAKDLIAIRPAGLLPILFSLQNDHYYKLLVSDFDKSYA